MVTNYECVMQTKKKCSEHVLGPGMQDVRIWPDIPSFWSSLKPACPSFWSFEQAYVVINSVVSSVEFIVIRMNYRGRSATKVLSLCCDFSVIIHKIYIA